MSEKDVVYFQPEDNETIAESEKVKKKLQVQTRVENYFFFIFYFLRYTE